MIKSNFDELKQMWNIEDDNKVLYRLSSMIKPYTKELKYLKEFDYEDFIDECVIRILSDLSNLNNLDYVVKSTYIEYMMRFHYDNIVDYIIDENKYKFDKYRINHDISDMKNVVESLYTGNSDTILYIGDIFTM